MAHICLKDTGYLNLQRTGSTVNRMNGGDEMDLTNTARVRLRWGANLESAPEPGTGAFVSTQPVSFENRIFEVDMVLLKTSSTDQELLRDLCGISGSNTYPGAIGTTGVKLLYVNGTSDTKKTIIELLGATGTSFHSANPASNSGTIDTTYPAILGFIENITVEDSADGTALRVKMTFKETNG
jgi:hypothetical protein